MVTITYDKASRDWYDDIILSLHNGKLKLEYNPASFPWVARTQPLSVEARGEELDYILGIICNIPFVNRTDRPRDERSMIWHGDLAKFIIYNLDIDWRPVIKEHW